MGAVRESLTESVTRLFRTTRSDTVRAVRSFGFIAGVTALVLMIAFACLSEVTDTLREYKYLGHAPEKGFHIALIMDALKSESFTLAMPLLVALPFTTAFVDDVRNGFIKQYLPRTSRKRYIVGKIAACTVSGGLVLLAGVLISFIISAAVFAPKEVAKDFEDFQQGSPQIVSPLQDEPPEEYFWYSVFVKSGMLFVAGMFWSLAGFVSASLTMNRYMAYASPFILYYLLVILHERYFPFATLLSPKEWAILEYMILTAALSVGFAVYAGRRLKDV
ncbi:MAG: hypothetical protein FWF82_05820 [Oscillospiraceae bacterium]|nr:hypothetical protein [Oscillospiraceae bacterium]